MAIVTTDDRHYKAIADTLREYAGEGLEEDFGTDKMLPSEMAERTTYAIEQFGFRQFEEGLTEGVDEGYSEGYSTGHTEGYEEGKTDGFEEGAAEGYTNGYNEGFGLGKNEGKQAERDRFWDEYQDNGNRTQYLNGYAGFSWSEKIFFPKYPMRLVGSNGSMFSYSSFKDLKSHMETHGIVVDTSQATVLEMFFRGSTITRYGTLDCTGATNLNYLLYRANHLQHIDKVIIKSDGSQPVTSFAQNCNALEEITIEGVFGQTGLSFQQSTKLSKASHVSVFTALSSTTSGLTVTFSLVAVNKAFETSPGAADGSTSPEWLALVATKPNWTIKLA